MSIKNLNDQMLMQKTEVLVREEREVLKNLLHYFREIERRRLYCDFKYGSLHKMLVGHFGYSDDEAYRRTSAMKLIKELPEVEDKITNGELSLSHLGLAQTFFKKEAKIQKTEISKEVKLKLLSQISEQPIREAQRIVISHSSAPEEMRPDKVSVISEQKLEYRFTADHKLEAKISEVKGLLAHKYPNVSMGELLEVLCDISIETLKSRKTAKSRKPCLSKSGDSVKEQAPPKAASREEEFESGELKVANPSEEFKTGEFKSKPATLTISNARMTSYAQIKREVWSESHFKCSNCRSQFAMETDHRLPVSKGGGNSKANLCVLCRSCNQRAAIRQLGLKKMDLYLS